MDPDGNIKKFVVKTQKQKIKVLPMITPIVEFIIRDSSHDTQYKMVFPDVNDDLSDIMKPKRSQATQLRFSISQKSLRSSTSTQKPIFQP